MSEKAAAAALDCGAPLLREVLFAARDGGGLFELSRRIAAAEGIRGPDAGLFSRAVLGRLREVSSLFARPPRSPGSTWRPAPAHGPQSPQVARARWFPERLELLRPSWASADALAWGLLDDGLQLAVRSSRLVLRDLPRKAWTRASGEALDRWGNEVLGLDHAAAHARLRADRLLRPLALEAARALHGKAAYVGTRAVRCGGGSECLGAVDGKPAWALTDIGSPGAARRRCAACRATPGRAEYRSRVAHYLRAHPEAAGRRGKAWRLRIAARRQARILAEKHRDCLAVTSGRDGPMMRPCPRTSQPAEQRPASACPREISSGSSMRG